MKMISKIAKVALGLVLVGSSSVFAQSLDDAKKAIDAEQYQKAKSMLKNLTVTQPTKDENFFYLGWVYLIQDYPDSAAAQFNKGLAVDPKSALNTVGLGAVAHVNKDASGVSANFNKAVALASKKDSKPYLYMAKAYLLLAPGVKTVSADDATAAIALLKKGNVANPKDVEVLVELGNVSRSQKDTGGAYDNYNAALLLDPKSLTATVAEGVLWENAQNFEDAEKQFKAAIAIDPNFGPAYREWAETDLYWAHVGAREIKVAKAKEGVEHYQKYLSLTDESVETLLRYADFLYNAGDYQTLQDVASKLAKSANSNARVYRYIGYSAYQTKDYKSGLDAMNNWFAKAAPDRILAPDYLVLGRLQVEGGTDTAKGVANLKKYADLDTTKTEEIYRDIANLYRTKRKYPEAIKAYQDLFSKAHGQLLLNDHFNLGTSAYLYFHAQTRAAKANPAVKPDSSLLVVADSAFSAVQKGNPNPLYQTAQFRARIADDKDADIINLKGLAKPYWEQVIAILSAKDATKLTDGEKGALASAYAYLGNYALYHDKDEAKADDWFTKDKALDPTEYYQGIYFKNKETAAENAAAEAARKAKQPVKKPAGK